MVVSSSVVPSRLSLVLSANSYSASTTSVADVRALPQYSTTFFSTIGPITTDVSFLAGSGVSENSFFAAFNASLSALNKLA